MQTFTKSFIIIIIVFASNLIAFDEVLLSRIVLLAFECIPAFFNCLGRGIVV